MKCDNVGKQRFFLLVLFFQATFIFHRHFSLPMFLFVCAVHVFGFVMASLWELLRAPSIIVGAPNKVAKMTFREDYFRKNLLPKSFRKIPFSETFRKNLLPEENFVIPEELRNTFWKNVIRNVSGRRCFRKITFYFRKKGFSEIFFFKK